MEPTGAVRSASPMVGQMRRSRKPRLQSPTRLGRRTDTVARPLLGVPAAGDPPRIPIGKMQGATSFSGVSKRPNRFGGGNIYSTAAGVDSPGPMYFPNLTEVQKSSTQRGFPRSIRRCVWFPDANSAWKRDNIVGPNAYDYTSDATGEAKPNVLGCKLPARPATTEPEVGRGASPLSQAAEKESPLPPGPATYIVEDSDHQRFIRRERGAVAFSTGIGHNLEEFIINKESPGPITLTQMDDALPTAHTPPKRYPGVTKISTAPRDPPSLGASNSPGPTDYLPSMAASEKRMGSPIIKRPLFESA